MITALPLLYGQYMSRAGLGPSLSSHHLISISKRAGRYLSSRFESKPKLVSLVIDNKRHPLRKSSSPRSRAKCNSSAGRKRIGPGGTSRGGTATSGGAQARQARKTYTRSEGRKAGEGPKSCADSDSGPGCVATASYCQAIGTTFTNTDRHGGRISAPKPPPPPPVESQAPVVAKAVATPPERVAVAPPPPVATPVPALPAQPVPPDASGNALASTAGGGTWKTFPAGKMPLGRLITTGDLKDLADRGTAGERVYLKGQFVVKYCRCESRCLASAAKTHRYRSAFWRWLSTRIIVDYPPVTGAAQGSVVNRDESASV